MSIERIDSDGPYSRENCKWGSRIEQARNRRFLGGRAGRLISACGKSMTIADWHEESGIDEDTIRWRLKVGWDPEAAVTLPPFSHRQNRRVIEMDGVSRSIYEWADHPGVTASAGTIAQRYFERRWAARDAVM